MSKEINLHMKFPLWVAPPIKNILEIYANWAASHDDDLAQSGCETLGHPTAALVKSDSLSSHILDFGRCMELSIIAVKKTGLTKLDGVNIT